MCNYTWQALQTKLVHGEHTNWLELKLERTQREMSEVKKELRKCRGDFHQLTEHKGKSRLANLHKRTRQRHSRRRDKGFRSSVDTPAGNARTHIPYLEHTSRAPER